MARAHSDLEIQLDISLAGCHCGGQIEQVGRALVYHHNVPYAVVRLQCRECGVTAEREYDISSYVDMGDTTQGPLNPTDEPSELLDIVQYGHLARFYLEFVQNGITDLQRDQAEGVLGLATVSVEEAIKHLRGGMFPPPEAAFTPDRQMLLQANPDAFNRENLDLFKEGILQFANKLPAVYDILEQLTGDHQKDLQILDAMAARHKDDPILHPQIGRIAKSLVIDEDLKQEKH